MYCWHTIWLSLCHLVSACFAGNLYVHNLFCSTLTRQKAVTGLYLAKKRSMQGIKQWRTSGREEPMANNNERKNKKATKIF
jgi:hypothetical protein